MHNQEDTYVNFDKIIERIRVGKIEFISFERTIEKITLVKNIVDAMGNETIIPKGITIKGVKTITGYFTNIRMKHQDSWRPAARRTISILVY
ncbi:MAG: hypothetical protein LH478_00480 [Chitinophagaceae bacterium]|nr:hypothetical protein [Chitinophagaceae bacterium]